LVGVSFFCCYLRFGVRRCYRCFFFLFVLLLLDLREEESWYSFYKGSTNFSVVSLQVACSILCFWVYTLFSHTHVLLAVNDTANQEPVFFEESFFCFDLWFIGANSLKSFEWVQLSFFLQNDLFAIGYSLYTYFFFLLGMVGFLLFISMFCSINLFLLKEKI